MKQWQKIGLGIGAILLFVVIAQANSQGSTIIPKNNSAAKSVPIQQEIKQQEIYTTEQFNPRATQQHKKTYNQTKTLQNTRTYVNSRGSTIQSPTYYQVQPAGASARCRDGTYSFSQSRRGTCSHHGGVEEWL